MSESIDPDGPEDTELEAEALPLHRQPWVRFAIGFSVAVMGFEVVYQGLVLDSLAFQKFMKALTVAAGFVIEPFYENVTSTNARLATSFFVVAVDDGCDGLQVCTLFTAAVLAFPATWRQKLTGIVLGNLWLQVWNVARIASLVVIGGLHREWFEPTHVYIWPTILIALCLATWMIWVRWTSRDDEGPGHAAAA